MKVKLKDIIVEDRFREDYGEIEVLAESIEKYGLLHPPVIDKNYNLIAGGRRYQACEFLGWEEIDVNMLEELDELTRKEIELEENLKRKDFTWVEEVRAKESLDLIKKIQKGEKVKGHASDGWGVEDTANLLHESPATVSIDINLSKALDKYEELKKCKTKSDAIRELKKIEESEKMAKAGEMLKDIQYDEFYTLIKDDCLAWMKKQESESFDLILADPPWGIDMDTKSKMSRERDVEYSDGLEETLILVEKAFKEFYRLLKDNRHLYVYFGISKYQFFKSLIQNAGFKVSAIPLIYNKNHGGAAAKGKTFPNAYETIFHCWKGSRKLNITDHNVFTIKRPSGKDRVHSAQKPIEMNEKLVKASTMPGEKILVPFMGSGSSVVAAAKNKRKVTGVEINSTSYASALEFIQRKLSEEV